MQPSPEQEKIIEKVINRIAPKHTFGMYTLDDIKQESYIMCLEGLKNYDTSRPFENFIASHLSRRLKDLIRKKYHRKYLNSESYIKLNETKKNLAELKSIGTYDLPNEEYDIIDKIGTQEALDIVLDNLSPSMRSDFYRLANGVSIQSAHRKKLFAKVREILDEDW